LKRTKWSTITSYPKVNRPEDVKHPLGMANTFRGFQISPIPNATSNCGTLSKSSLHFIAKAAIRKTSKFHQQGSFVLNKRFPLFTERVLLHMPSLDYLHLGLLR